MRKKPSKSRSNGVENIKLMIVAISLTAMLLFWSVFSAYDSRELIEEAQNSNSELAINLPPVPTVVPINNEEEEDSIAGPQPVPTLRSVTEPEKKYAAPQEGPVIIGGGGGGGGGGGTSTKAS